jgi:hypothetical protein
MTGLGIGAIAAPGQQRLVVLDDQFVVGGLLNVPILYRLRGSLDPAALNRALDRVVDRHEALRTTFERVGLRRLREHVLPSGVHVSLRETAVSGADEADPLIAARAAELFDLDGLPLTADLYRLPGAEYVLLINVDHRVTDGWSNMLIRRDLVRLYNAETGVAAEPLPAIEWLPRDYYAWQAARLAGEPGRRHAEYWDRQAPLLKWAGLRRRAEKLGERRPPFRAVDLALAPGDVAALREVAAAERTTLFTVLLALLFGVLHAATGERGLVVCSTHANRIRPEIWNTVGSFASGTFLRVDLPSEPTFRDVLRATRTTALDAMAHQEYSYINLLTHPGTTPRTVSRAAEVAFNMLATPPNMEALGAVDFHGLETVMLPFPAGLSSHFGLELLITPMPDGLRGMLRWAEGIYEPELVTALADTYEAMTSAVARDPAVALSGFLKRFR